VLDEEEELDRSVPRGDEATELSTDESCLAMADKFVTADSFAKANEEEPVEPTRSLVSGCETEDLSPGPSLVSVGDFLDDDDDERFPGSRTDFSPPDGA
jgi:hypothetical protein